MMVKECQEQQSRRAELSIRLSEFEIPPIQDVLLVGRKAPIGPGAVRRMADVMSPEQYEIINIEEGIIEALVVRKALLTLIPKQKLVDILLEEGKKIANESSVIKAQVDISVVIKRTVEL